MRRINVLHTIGWLGYGGMEVGVVKLLNNLNRDVFQPHLVAISGRDDHGLAALSRDVRFEWIPKREGRDWGMVRRLARHFSRNDIDIVHSHNWGTWLYSYLAARLARVPLFVHGEHGRDSEHIDDSWLKDRFKTFLAHQTPRLTTVSYDIAEEMIERWRVPPSRIEVIPNGVDLARFRVPRDRRKAKLRVGFRPDALVLGTVVGNFRPVKDLPTLFRAFARVRDKFPTALLAVVGGRLDELAHESEDGRYFNELLGLANRLGIDQGVRFLGPQDRVERYMQAFDVYVNSSVYEGMSNTILEAMACGAAVVATEVGGTPKIVFHDFNGLLVAQRSPEELAGAISDILAAPERRERLSRNARHYVENNHDADDFIRRHEQLYLDLLSGKGLSGRIAHASEGLAQPKRVVS